MFPAGTASDSLSPFIDVRITQAFMKLVEHVAVEARENLHGIANVNYLNHHHGSSCPSVGNGSDSSNNIANGKPIPPPMSAKGLSEPHQQGGRSSTSPTPPMPPTLATAGGGGGSPNSSPQSSQNCCTACSSSSSNLFSLSHPHQQLSSSDVLRRFIAGIYERPTSQFYAGDAANVFMADLKSAVAASSSQFGLEGDPSCNGSGVGGVRGHSLSAAAEMVIRAFPTNVLPSTVKSSSSVFFGGAADASSAANTPQRPPSTAGAGKTITTGGSPSATVNNLLATATAASNVATTTSTSTGAASPLDPPASLYHHTACPTVSINANAEYFLVERPDENIDPLQAAAPVITSKRVEALLRDVIGWYAGAVYHETSSSWIGSPEAPHSGVSNTAGYCRGTPPPTMPAARGGPQGVSASTPSTNNNARSASPVAGRGGKGGATSNQRAAPSHQQVDTPGSDDDADTSTSNHPNNNRGGGLTRSASMGRRGSNNNANGSGYPGDERNNAVPFPVLALPTPEVQEWEERDAGFHLVVTSLLQDVGEYCLDQCLSDAQSQQVLLCTDALLQTISAAHTGSDVVDCEDGGDYHRDLIGSVRKCMEDCVAAMTLENEEDDDDEQEGEEEPAIPTRQVTIVRRQPTFKTVEEKQLRPDSLQSWMARRSGIIDGTPTTSHRGSTSPVAGGFGGSTSNRLPIIDGSVGGGAGGDMNTDEATVSMMGESLGGGGGDVTIVCLTAADLDPSQLPTLPPPTSYTHLNAAARKLLIAHDETLLQLPAMVVRRRVRLVEEVPQTITIYSNVPWGSAIGFLKLVQRCVLPNLPLFAFCLQPTEVLTDSLVLNEACVELGEYLPETTHVSGMEMVVIHPIVEDVPPNLLPPMGNIHAYALARGVPGSYVPPSPTVSREQAMLHLHQLLSSLDASFDDRESCATSIAPAATTSGGRTSSRGGARRGTKAAKESGGLVTGLPGVTLPGGGTLGMGVSESGSTYNLLDGSASNPFLVYLANLSQQQPPVDPFANIGGGGGVEAPLSSSSADDDPSHFNPLFPKEEPPLPLHVFLAYRARVSYINDVEDTLRDLFNTLWVDPLHRHYSSQFGPVQNQLIAHEQQLKAEDKASALSRGDFMKASGVAEHRLKKSVVISPHSPLRGVAASTLPTPADAKADASNETPRQSRGKGSRGKGGSSNAGTRLSVSKAQISANNATASAAAAASSGDATPPQTAIGSSASASNTPITTTKPEPPSALETFLLQAAERVGKLEKHVEVMHSPPNSAPPPGRGGKQPTAPHKSNSKSPGARR